MGRVGGGQGGKGGRRLFPLCSPLPCAPLLCKARSTAFRRTCLLKAIPNFSNFMLFEQRPMCTVQVAETSNVYTALDYISILEHLIERWASQYSLLSNCRYLHPS